MGFNHLYIHIPFCASKCNYCSFVSHVKNTAEFFMPYFKALMSEIEFYSQNCYGEELKSIYIGGGTPSCVNLKYYKELFKLLRNSFNISKTAEITMESNPESASHDFFCGISKLGINRLSIGIQSFRDEELKLLGRVHDSSQAEKAVFTAKNSGFKNISIDLMYGLSAQTQTSWEDTLYKALELDVQHISAYGLKIEKNTKFFYFPPENFPDDEIQRGMYLKTIEILENAGFSHYEISNFVQSSSSNDYKSIHNLAYWQNKNYAGAGLSAHGYLDGIRYAKTPRMRDYLQNPLKNLSETILTPDDIIREALFLGLRLRTGINVSDFKEKYGFDIVEKFSKTIEKYTQWGFMSFDNRNLRLSSQGVLLSNSILADFL